MSDRERELMLIALQAAASLIAQGKNDPALVALHSLIRQIEEPPRRGSPPA